MSTESTVSATLLDGIEALGWPAIGESSQGRPLRGRRLAGEADGALVLVGGVHGDEPSSVAAVLDLLAALATAAPLPRPVWVVPALNPDGLLRGAKNSARDVDLNRNFPARNFTREHRPGYDPGPAPLSEPETRALAELIDGASPIGVVAVHAPFACINFDGPSAAWAEAVARASGWPARADLGYSTPGSLGSWLGVDRGLPVLTVELPAGGYPAFAAAARAGLEAAVRWSFGAGPLGGGARIGGGDPRTTPK
jgi:hypothetical protein